MQSNSIQIYNKFQITLIEDYHKICEIYTKNFEM